MSKAQGDTTDRDPVVQDRTVDSSGNPKAKPYNLNLDKILSDGTGADGSGLGSGKLPRDGR
jgi:hypothetical protein